MNEDQAVALMNHGRFRHLPLVDAAGRVVGTLSVRHLLRQRVDRLDLKNNDLIAYLATDGAGG
jgi:CBS domain-containing protein